MTDSSSDSASHTYSALVRALCPGALRAGLLRAAWRTALCAWRWRKAGGLLPHSSFVFSKRKLQELCVGRWGPVSLWMCVLSSALVTLWREGVPTVATSIAARAHSPPSPRGTNAEHSCRNTEWIVSVWVCQWPHSGCDRAPNICGPSSWSKLNTNSK